MNDHPMFDAVTDATLKRMHAIEANPRRDPPQDRYYRDPEFHALVDMIEQFIERGDFTPTELREAVMVAAVRYEMRTVRSVLLERGVMR